MTRKLVAALETVEKVTKIISTNAASISVQIPLVKILQKAYDDDSGIQTIKTEMLKSLERRFNDAEDSKPLLIATCLDPRFKDKFFSSVAKGLARNLVIDSITNTDIEGPQSKRPRTESDAASTSKVWECFTEIL